MATTGTVSGNDVGISIDTDLIACATSASIDFSTNMIDSTCKDNNGAEQVKPSQQTWSMALDGNLAFDSAYGWVDLVTAWKAGTLMNVSWGTTETGDPNYSGTAYIDSLSASAPVNDIVTYSVNFKGTGEVTIGVNA